MCAATAKTIKTIASRNKRPISIIFFACAEFLFAAASNLAALETNQKKHNSAPIKTAPHKKNCPCEINCMIIIAATARKILQLRPKIIITCFMRANFRRLKNFPCNKFFLLHEIKKSSNLSKDSSQKFLLNRFHEKYFLLMFEIIKATSNFVIGLFPLKVLSP